MPFVTVVLGVAAALALAICVTVIDVQVQRTINARAEVDAALAGLPGGLVALEPAMDTIDGSRARIAEATARRVHS